MMWSSDSVTSLLPAKPPDRRVDRRAGVIDMPSHLPFATTPTTLMAPPSAHRRAASPQPPHLARLPGLTAEIRDELVKVVNDGDGDEVEDVGSLLVPDSNEEAVVCDVVKTKKMRHPLPTTFSGWARIVLPHVGLVLLLALYTTGGAVVFHLTELPHEIIQRGQLKANISNIRESLKSKLWSVTHDNYTDISEDDFNRLADYDLDDLSTAYWKAFQSQYITIKELHNASEAMTLWTFPNSIFFSTTVITTIGYGNLAPVTSFGRMFCIGFGLFGIPLLLVTIADIGKFLSDFLNFLYRHYRSCMRNLRRTSRKLSMRARRSISKSPSPGEALDGTLTRSQLGIDHESELSDEDELRIPVVWVLLVLLGYTAAGGLLFEWLEGLKYFDAFYFCFITMATVGFGDIVPTKQVYMMITMCYIVMGLALTTMCIDLAGTEYIRKIHYLGQKMDTAKGLLGGAVVRGAHMGETFFKETGYGIIRTAGGRLVAVRRGSDDDFMFDDIQRNILYEPLSPAVQRQCMKARIHVLPDDLKEDDIGFIVRNKNYNRQPRRKFYYTAPHSIQRTIVRRGSGSAVGGGRLGGGRIVDGNRQKCVLVAPFLWRESHV